MMGLTIAVGFYVLFAAILFVLQQKMIYPAGHYGIAPDRLLPKSAQTLKFRTSEGDQVAYLLPPAQRPTAPVSAAHPLTLWVCFHGNASLALDWLEVLDPPPDPHAAHLLIEYPGYGENPGSAWAWTIRDSSQAALVEAVKVLRERGDLPGDLPNGDAIRINLLGYSIGAAAALQFAADHPPHRVVLLAPFTRLGDIARRQVGRPLSWLLRDSYDNAARLDELAALPNPPRVAIFHGTADPLIPSSMSQQLAAAHPTMIRLTLVERVDHGWILDAIKGPLHQELRSAEGESSPTLTTPTEPPAGSHAPRR